MTMNRLMVFAVICSGIWAYVHFAFPDYSHRFRLSIEVETPEGKRSGSSVMESLLQDNGYLPTPGRSLNLHFKGEAVFVDLGQGRNLIASLSFGENNRDFATTLALRAWGLPANEKSSWSAISSASGRKSLTNDLIPLLVSFADLNNPKSVRIVRPNELDRIFGPGFRLAAVWIELTDDRVTKSIETKLPWLQGFKGTLGGQVQRDLQRPERNLTGNDFIRGHI